MSNPTPDPAGDLTTYQVAWGAPDPDPDAPSEYTAAELAQIEAHIHWLGEQLAQLNQPGQYDHGLYQDYSDDLELAQAEWEYATGQCSREDYEGRVQDVKYTVDGMPRSPSRYSYPEDELKAWGLA